MFDKLLLPIDPSKRLKPARDYAVALAHKFDIPLTAIFVSNPSKTGTVTASKDTRDGIVALGKRQLEQFVEETKEIKVKSILKTGVRHEVLSKMVDNGNADTLILGPFRSFLTRLFTGSEVERILDSESSHAFVVRKSHPLPGPGSPALVVFDGKSLSDPALQSIENFARKFNCDLELLYLSSKVLHDAKKIDTAVSELRNNLGEGFHVTSTIEPLSFFKTRKSLTNSVVSSEGARIVLLPNIDYAVSDILLHQLVLSASVPVCVLK